MRITERAISNNFMSSVNQSRERIVDLQSKVAAGKSVLKPSDDPRATNAILRLQASIAANDQYSSNVADGSSIAQSTADSLDAFSSMYLELKDIVTRASNPTAISQYPAFAEEVDQLLTQGLNTANTKFNGKYLFGGTQTSDPPYTISADRSTVTKNPKGVDGTISYAIGDGLTQQVNVPGEDAFKGTALFDLMIQIRDSLKNGTQPTVVQMTGVDDGYDHLVMKSSQAGSYVQSFDNLNSHLADQKNQLTQFLSDNQDADLAQSVTQLKQEETMLDAALNTGAKTIPRTLLDFLQ